MSILLMLLLNYDIQSSRQPKTQTKVCQTGPENTQCLLLQNLPKNNNQQQQCKNLILI